MKIQQLQKVTKNLYMQKQQKKNNLQEKNLKWSLKQQNLVPIYLIEDNLRQNFKQIQNFISYQQQQNKEVDKRIVKLNDNVENMDKKYTSKFPQMQKLIFNNIKQEIQGTVSVVLSNQLKNILQKLNQGQQKQYKKQEQNKKRQQQIHKKLSYEIAQQNQKYFIKQIGRIQKEIDKKITAQIQKSNPFGKSNQWANKKSQQKQKGIKQQKDQQKDKSSSPQKDQSSKLSFGNNNNSIGVSKFSQEAFQHINQSVQILKSKIYKFQQFTTSIDKRFIQNFQQLKENWKELGTELLDNKKINNKKVQDLNIEFVKLKNVLDFSKMPEISEDSFKKKIMEKFTQFYKIVGTLTPKSEFQIVNERYKKIITRHSQQLMQIRRQLSKNNQYFTLYMNNSKTDDLSQKINKIKSQIINDKKYIDSMIEEILLSSDKVKKDIGEIGRSIGSLQMTNQNQDDKIKQINNMLKQMNEKIIYLQDLNDIGPSKMKKIHDSLDFDQNFVQYQAPSSPLQKTSSQQLSINKQLKHQIQKIKDQLFVFVSQKNMKGIEKQDDFSELKTQLKQMGKKIEKFKNQNGQAIISRKPWVCLSCDKQKLKQKLKEPILQRDTSRKKISLEIGKSGGFLTNRNSDKNIKYNLNPQSQQKFQVYEKYRQKYLTDTLKLPQIYKQKFGGDLDDLMS